MIIEKVMLKKHLRAGDREYNVGIYPNPSNDPIPEDILAEIHREDVVEVLESSQPPSPEASSSAGERSVWEREAKSKPEEQPSAGSEPVVRRARRAR